MHEPTRWADPIEEQLLEAWRFVLKDRAVGRDDEWNAVGGTSLDALDVAWRIEEISAIKFPLSLFVEEPSITRQAAWLRANTGRRPWNPIVRLRQGTEQKPFFCIHPIDGNVLCYTDIAAAMDEGRPFCGIQARGLDGIEQPLATFAEIADYYLAAIRGVQRKGPYYLGGWSVGGVLAFEVAQRLRAQGHAVGLLAMIDTLFPAHGTSSARRARAEREELERYFLDAPAPLPKDYAAARVIHALIFDELLRYTPQPYDGKITMICAEQQLAHAGEALEAVRIELRKGPFGKPRRLLRRAARFERMSPLWWRSVATGGFEVIPVAGKHETVVLGASAASIARLLTERLPSP